MFLIQYSMFTFSHILQYLLKFIPAFSPILLPLYNFARIYTIYMHYPFYFLVPFSNFTFLVHSCEFQLSSHILLYMGSIYISIIYLLTRCLYFICFLLFLYLRGHFFASSFAIDPSNRVIRRRFWHIFL
jgi:hypothetical protein